jgi:heavy metal translocating P-type ATPase
MAPSHKNSSKKSAFEAPLQNLAPETLDDAVEARLVPPASERRETADPRSDRDVEPDREHSSTPEWSELARIAFVALCAIAVWLHAWEPWSRASIIGLFGTLVGGWPIYREALENIRERRMTMELSMTVALLAALVIGEVFTALVITAFVLAAEVLEGLTVGRGRRAIQDLLNYLPPTATVRRTGGEREIPLTEVHVGNIVLVAPGGRIPVDGTVTGGHSYVDQATITGESIPISKAIGDSVFAGTINQAGSLEISAERLGQDTSFGKIVQAVESAERSRAPVQKTADRYAAYLVYFALGCAALTFALTRDARATISVIIVAGACGIAAGTPLAILGAIGRAARAGAIIKGGRHLEALWSVNTVAFDKTGTLTFGKPAVQSIEPVAGVTEEMVLEAAALAERRSEHPLGKAILARAAEQGLATSEPDDFMSVPGRGVVVRAGEEAIIAGARALLSEHGVIGMPELRGVNDPHGPPTSEVLVARNGRLLGTIRVADTIRTEAGSAIRALQSMSITTILLTGDNVVAAEAVATALGIGDVRSALLPERKLEALDDLLGAGRTVAMVGDGVNDAPALAHASVGIAMGSGTDVARESADIVLLGNDLSRFVETLRIARQCHQIIRFNLFGTLAVDAVGVGLAAFGYLNPLMAAFIHVASELTFILNSARLLPSLENADREQIPTSALKTALVSSK